MREALMRLQNWSEQHTSLGESRPLRGITRSWEWTFKSLCDFPAFYVTNNLLQTWGPWALMLNWNDALCSVLYLLNFWVKIDTIPGFSIQGFLLVVTTVRMHTIWIVKFHLTWPLGARSNLASQCELQIGFPIGGQYIWNAFPVPKSYNR